MSEQPQNYLRSVDYAKKYGLSKMGMAPACRNNALIGKKCLEWDRIKKKSMDRWFILDIPPSEHPGWTKYSTKGKLAYVKKDGAGYSKDFDKHAPIFLERFNQARVKVSAVTFSVSEVAKMLETSTVVINYFSQIGIKGYGSLPRLRIPPDKVEKYNTGSTDFYYDTTSIVRFFSKQLGSKKKFKTRDDALIDLRIDNIVQRHGYFVFDGSAVAQLTLEGFLEWTRKHIYIWDRKHRKVKKFVPNEKQVELYRHAFTWNDEGTFQYKTLCACRPRGDYKTFDMALLSLFRFFNMPKEQIFYVANSEKQTKHLLFEEAREIIRRSPTLKETPGLDIDKQKGIYLKSGKKEIYSQIEMMTVESGARSNATCFCFSEVWKLTDVSNFAEIIQSIRGVVNAWSLIESTVARKGHPFHQFYVAYTKGETTQLYFQYYGGKNYNPNITEEYRTEQKALLPIQFKMFFDNKWEDAATGLFDEGRIEEMGILGIDGHSERTIDLVTSIKEIVKCRKTMMQYGGIAHKSAEGSVNDAKHKLDMINKRLRRVDDLYTLPAPDDIVSVLKEMFQSPVYIGVGLDRAKQLTKRTDRTALVTVARVAIEIDPELMHEINIYFVLDLYMPEKPSKENIMDRINHNNAHFGMIGRIQLEEYQALDLHEDCENAGYETVLVPQSYKQQEENFSETSLALDEGRLKCPTVMIWQDEHGIIHTTRAPVGKMDILREEMSEFEYEAPLPGRKTGYFGSPYKRDKKRTKIGEVKDDSVYGLGHGIKAAQDATIEAMVATNMGFHAPIINEDIIGDY